HKSGRPGVIQGMRLFGAPSPSFGGRKKEKAYGQTPAPDPSPRPPNYCHVLSAVVPAERLKRVYARLRRAMAREPGPSKHSHGSSCTAVPHHIVQRLLSPRFRGDDNREV